MTKRGVISGNDTLPEEPAAGKSSSDRSNLNDLADNALTRLSDAAAKASS
jgi:hypothetical protein